MTLRVAIPGCGGRMGRALIQAIVADPRTELTAAAELAGAGIIGQDAGAIAGVAPLGVSVGDDLEAMVQSADAVIDFTVPAVTRALAGLCGTAGKPLIVGTTGLTAEDQATLRVAAASAPVVYAPNMSVGVNVLLRLAAEAARLLGEDFELEIVEAHHHDKVDAPSGTALRLAEVLADATGGDLERRGCYGRRGHAGRRPPDQIGIHTVRGGDIVGEHTVMFCGQGERVELAHRASSRQTFARGALRALEWAASRPPGLYDMQDVLGLSGR